MMIPAPSSTPLYVSIPAGTVLHCASLLATDDDEPLPPLVCFAMGTLGFLTPFDINTYRSSLEYILNVPPGRSLNCTLR